MSTFQRILIIALVAQLALIAFVFWPRPAASAGEPLLGALTTGAVTAITITDEQGVSTRLVKQGESWLAASAADYPADAARITSVIDQLVVIKAGKAVATTAASHAQLQVADNAFQRKIELTRTDGSTQTIYLGSQAGGQSVHTRLGGANEVYLSSELSAREVAADVLSWVNPVYLAVNASDMTGFTLQNQNGEFALSRDAQDQWQFDGLAGGETLDANKASSLVSAASSLRMTQPLGKTADPTWGLQQPAAIVTLQVKSGDATQPITLTIGSQDASDNSYVVKSSESDYYVRVADYTVEELVSRDRAGFLTATPTPSTPGTPAP